MKKKKIKKQIFKRTLALFGAMLAIMSTMAISVFAESPLQVTKPGESGITIEKPNLIENHVYKENEKPLILKTANQNFKPIGFILDDKNKNAYGVYSVSFKDNVAFNEVLNYTFNLAINLDVAGCDIIHYNFNNYSNVSFTNHGIGVVQYTFKYNQPSIYLQSSSIQMSITATKGFLKLLYNLDDSMLYAITYSKDDNSILKCAFSAEDSKFILENLLPRYEDVPTGYTFNPEYKPPEKPVDNILKPLITALVDFVKGLGSAFVGAFTAVFLTAEGGLNNLGIFLLVFFGLALGYGVIRWITGLFRRQ